MRTVSTHPKQTSSCACTGQSAVQRPHDPVKGFTIFDPRRSWWRTVPSSSGSARSTGGPPHCRSAAERVPSDVDRQICLDLSRPMRFKFRARRNRLACGQQSRREHSSGGGGMLNARSRSRFDRLRWVLCAATRFRPLVTAEERGPRIGWRDARLPAVHARPCIEDH